MTARDRYADRLWEAVRRARIGAECRDECWCGGRETMRDASELTPPRPGATNSDRPGRLATCRGGG